jgi:hypothetical protein
VNPILERIDFWECAETVIEGLTGATHRHDTAVRGNGPGPHGIDAYRPVRPAPVIISTKPRARECPKKSGAQSGQRKRPRSKRNAVGRKARPTFPTKLLRGSGFTPDREMDNHPTVIKSRLR